MPYGQFGRLQENLNFLFVRIKRGGKQDIAAAIGVSPVTISRWLSGTQDVSPRHLAAILKCFELPEWLPMHDLPLTPDLVLRYRLAQQILTLHDDALCAIAGEYLLQYLQVKLTSNGCSACSHR